MFRRFFLLKNTHRGKVFTLKKMVFFSSIRAVFGPAIVGWCLISFQAFPIGEFHREWRFQQQ